MDLNWTFIAICLFFSLVGLAYFRYGKTQGRLGMVLIGLALMVYPYFCGDSNALVFAIGAGLSLFPVLMRKFF